MQFAIMFGEPRENFGDRTKPEAAPYWAAWNAYVGAINQAGIVVSGAGLQGPETAATVRVRDGARHVQDGPFADTKEQLGGFFVINVPDLDTALEWAARSPAASYGSVEVRPLMVMG